MSKPVVVVTGAAMGIGLGIVRRFQAGGYTVVGVDRDQAVLEVADRDSSDGADSFVPYVGDVTDPSTHDEAAALAMEHGQLSTWVNNAGVALPASIHEVTRESVERTWAINQGGTFWGSAAAVRTMLEHGIRGAIVNIASTQALRGFAEQPAYAASKGAIVSLSRQLAAEYAPKGIRCNAIAPGVIETPLNRALAEASGDAEATRRNWLDLCPIGRWGTPEDIAEAAWYLGTPVSSFVTGQLLVVDGGQTAVPPA
jgi:NAD(P)-dependent dehydrogenase (short-subunit alcohol dehydrogenase family)